MSLKDILSKLPAEDHETFPIVTSITKEFDITCTHNTTALSKCSGDDLVLIPLKFIQESRDSKKLLSQGKGILEQDRITSWKCTNNSVNCAVCRKQFYYCDYYGWTICQKCFLNEVPGMFEEEYWSEPEEIEIKDM